MLHSSLTYSAVFSDTVLCCPVVLQIQCCVVQVSGRYSAVLYSFGVDTVLCSTVLWQMKCCVVYFYNKYSAVVQFFGRYGAVFYGLGV